MEFDCLAMLAVSLLVVRLGKVPGWYISLGLARYLFVAGIWWRERRGLPVYDLTPSNTRRLAAGFQMAFFCVALWPIFGAPATAVAGTLFVAPILLGFVRDWLIVSGTVSPHSPGYRRFERWRDWAGLWLPPVLRWIGALTAVAFLLPALSQALVRRSQRPLPPPAPSRSRWGSARAWALSACSWRRWRAWRWSASSPMTPC